MIGKLSVTGTHTGIGFTPGNVSGIIAKPGNGKITLFWTDPNDEIIDEKVVSIWKGTKVVYKTGSYPVSPNDGVIAVNSEVRNQYSINGFEIGGLTNDTTYYFRFFPYNDTNAFNMDDFNRVSATPFSLKVYGIKRAVDNSLPTWERTDDAVGLTANAQVGETLVQNDFDDLYPWSNIISCNYDEDNEQITGYYGDNNFTFDGSNGTVYTIIPEFWWKREQPGDGYEYINIANAEVEGYTKSEEFMIGRYLVSDYTDISGYSKSGDNVVPKYSISYSSVRNAILNTSKSRCLLDWHIFLIQLLFLVEYATYDSQSVLGKGLQMTILGNNGVCDNLGMKSGHPNNTTGWDGIIYRGIENLYGQGMCFIDGIMATTRYHIGLKYDPTTYKNSTYDNIITYELPYASSNSYIKKLGYDSNNPLIMLPTNTGGSSTTYVPDAHAYGANSSGGERFCSGSYNEFEQGLFGGYWSSDTTWYGTFRVIKY